MKPENSLTENQRTIYEIAKVYLRKNPHFTFNELLIVCKRVSKLSDQEIIKILGHFIRKKFFVQGSRLTRDNILKNETRNQICEYISQNPGSNFTQILTHFKLGPYANRWHLEMLKKFGFVREQKFSRYKVYFDNNFPKDKDIVTFILRNKNIFKIYSILKNNPLNPTNLSKVLDLHHSTVQYHLNKLLKNNMVKANPDNIYSINIEFLYFLEQYYNFTLSPELSKKLAVYLELKKPTPPPSEEIIKILREYDYFRGNIRFKIAVQNTTNMTVSNIDVMITATSQYTLNKKVQTIDHLVPNETRGVEFILTPLTCGKSQVYATVAYTDGFGKPQSVIVHPKEVWIKCPLVSPKKVMENQINEWKKDLFKGSSTIQFESIHPKQMFEIAHNQITALDLAEVIFDDGNYRCVFSGIAKVTSTKIMVEATIISNTLILDVWADNMKQSTGFLAYIYNLINVALKSTQKLMGRVEQLGQKILNIFVITNRILKLFEYCKNLWIISEILIILKEINSRINRIFPDLEIIDQITNSIETFENNFNIGDSIREKDSLKLQISAQIWLNNLIRLTKTNIENFSDTFKEQDDQINHFTSLLTDLEVNNRNIINEIIIKILVRIIIIDKKTGICLYNQAFQETGTDSNLLSGFISAIQHFGSEISQEATSVKKIEYAGFEINLEDGQLSRAALILKGTAPDVLRKNLTTFIKEFESIYGLKVQNHKGDVSFFQDSHILVEKYFIETPHKEKLALSS
ncbi:MAG: hypothetical protein ACFFD2_19635 [Promethearchaeota archaeon]